MKLKWLNALPENPEEFLSFFKKRFGLKEEEVYKLYHLTFEVTALSEGPFHKFLEKTPNFLKLDEIKRRKYLLTLSVHTLRNLLREFFDTKFVKNLFLFVSEMLPKEFLKGVIPKHKVIASRDFSFKILSEEEKIKLPSYFKVNHLILVFKLDGNCEELIFFLPEFTFPYVIKKEEEYKVFFACSLSEFFLISSILKENKEFRKEVEAVLESLKTHFPDCFL